MLDSMRRFKADVFRALAHPTRVAILEHLADAELSVGALCARIGLEQANASQHLAVLRNKLIVLTRKDGNQIHYRLRDPRLGKVLEIMRDVFFAQLEEAGRVLREEKRQEKREARRASRENRE